MPAAAPAAARHSIGDALAVAARTGDKSLLASAHDAFTSAMSASFLAGGAGVLVAAVLAVFLMRDGRPAGASDQGATQVAPEKGEADEGVLGEGVAEVVSAGGAEVSH
jgi:hypothetical protein